MVSKEREGGAERKAKLMHRAAKDRGKYQHFLRKPFANGALKHGANFTLNTAMLYTVFGCILRDFWSFCPEMRGVFGNGIEPLLLVPPEKFSYYVLFAYASK